MILQITGRTEESLSYNQKAVELAPRDPAAQNNLGNTLRILGRLKEAEIHCLKAIELKPKYDAALNNLALTMRLQGRYEKAEKAFKQVITIDPKSTEAQFNLGELYLEQGKTAEAEKSFRRVLAIDPNFTPAYNNLGIVLQQLKRATEAEINYKKAVKLSPRDAQAYNNLGVCLAAQGKFFEAITTYEEAIALNRNYSQAHNNLALVLLNLEEVTKAETSCRHALEINPDYVEAYNNLALILEKQNRPKEAEKSIRKAIALRSSYAEAHYNLGLLLERQENLSGAESSYRQTIAIAPEHSKAHNNLGVVLQQLGNLAEAATSFEQAIAVNPRDTQAYRHLAILKKCKFQDDHFRSMKRLHKETSLNQEQRIDICFALATVCEQLQLFEQAFGYYEEANNLCKKLADYDLNKDVELFANIKRQYPLLVKYSPKVHKSKTDLLPIFIVGMPRSGTTLVEQIISSHSQITGAGELTFASDYGLSLASDSIEIDESLILKFRKNYFSQLKKYANGKKIVTDKMPLNFRLLGLISCAIPEAKLIHLTRAPAATCWANYKQFFEVQGGLGFSFDLKDVVEYYRLYSDLLMFWRDSLKDNLFDIQYEKLTEDPHLEISRLFSYLEIDLEDKCFSPHLNQRSVKTASYAQSRDKIYQNSSEKWLNFEPFVKGEFSRLIELSMKEK